MKAIGILFGIIMLISVFLPWEAYVGQDYMFLLRVSRFFGIHTKSFDRLFNLDFLPIVTTLVFMLSVLLSQKHLTWKIFALLGSLIGFVVGTYNIFYYYFISERTDYIPGDGLWIFATLSLLALVLSILILTKKYLLKYKLFQKLFVSEVNS